MIGYLGKGVLRFRCCHLICSGGGQQRGQPLHCHLK
uniref:Uncharacterized protein n=1 Tax=Anguilla anguilla TaxID=7936 RepID=A0A0E9T0A7_ANGAN